MDDSRVDTPSHKDGKWAVSDLTDETDAPENVLTSILDSRLLIRDDIVVSATGAQGDAGYQMIKSFEVTNFRSFRSLRLKGLPTINVLVGKSASGKTSLLEAIRMALGGTPNVAWTLNALRGVPVAIIMNPTRDQFESMFSPFFPDFDLTKAISFKVVDSSDREASVQIYFDDERPVTPVPQNIPNRPVLTNTIIPLAFKRRSFAGEESTLDATIHLQQGGQLFLQQGTELGTVSEFFSSTWQSNSQQVATWFSNLRIAKNADDIVKIIHKQFPEITDLSPEVPNGVPSLYATVKHHPRSMPISLISSGINKFVSLLIAIRTYRGGVILIDEIENGIYYQMFPAFWEALHRFAMQNNTQLFVSTHSWECLKAASSIIDRHSKDFSLIQVSQERGVSTALMVTGARAAAAIEADIEVRK